MARIWTYRSYVTPEGVDMVRVWFDGLDAHIAVHVQVQLGENRLLPLEVWKERDEYKALKRPLVGLEALRFMIPPPKKKKYQQDEVEHCRILGFCDPQRMEFTMVRGFQKEYGKDYYAIYGASALAVCQLCRKSYDHTKIADWLDYD